SFETSFAASRARLPVAGFARSGRRANSLGGLGPQEAGSGHESAATGPSTLREPPSPEFFERPAIGRSRGAARALRDRSLAPSAPTPRPFGQSGSPLRQAFAPPGRR